MSTFTTADGTQIFYKDWGSGRPVVFSHGWPLSGDAWDAQMLHMASNGFRTIAHDRRGHGRSAQTWLGNDMDTYADDLVQLIEALDLRDVMLVGHSTGGGEAARVAARLGTARVSRVVLVGAVAPVMLQSEANPKGVPMAVFDGIRDALAKDRAQLFRDFSEAFFGANRPGHAVTQGMKDSFWAQGMMGSLRGQYECIKAFSETDFTEDLKKLSMPVLVIHGDDDQIVPMPITGQRSAQIAPNARLKIYPGGSHALPDTAQAALNADLLEFASA